MKRADASEKSESDIQIELSRQLSPAMLSSDLAKQLSDILKSLGTKRPTVEVMAKHLAKYLAPKINAKSNALDAVIKYRPKQLASLVSEATWEQIREIIPAIETLRRKRFKPETEEERVQRRKAAKSRYDRSRDSIPSMGLIEKEFTEGSILSLSGILDGFPPHGPCLDDIFHGAKVRMAEDFYSLQSLFGLSRKRLSAAAPGMRKGREIFYDFKAVLRCMGGLLALPSDRAVWLVDPTRRRQVLTGVLFRCKQEGTPEIATAFERVLVPYLH